MAEISSNGCSAHAAGSIRVNFEAFIDLLTGPHCPASSRTNSPVSPAAIFTWADMADDKVSDQKAILKGCQSPVPGQPGWGALGLNMF